jgi:hypothetical protein
MAYLGFIVRSIIILMVSSNLVLAHKRRRTLRRAVKALSRRVTSLETSPKKPDAALTSRVASLEASLKKSNGRVAKLESSRADMIKIVSSQGKAGNANCARVCAGTTKRGSTTWETVAKKTVKAIIDMTKCGFATVPTITTAIEGTSKHFKATGTSSVYRAEKNSFILYVDSEHGPKGGANERSWNVEWVAVGYSC